MEPYEVKKSSTAYQGLIFDVVRETVRLPNGKDADRDIVRHHGAAAIIPVLADGNILLVHQYREAVGGFVLEIPAGKLDKDEQPYVCAVRELEEETGYKAASIRSLFSFHTAVGYSTEVIHIYLAEGLTQGQQQTDDDEFITLKKYSLEALMDMIADGSLTDVKTIAALLYYERFCLAARQ